MGRTIQVRNLKGYLTKRGFIGKYINLVYEGVKKDHMFEDENFLIKCEKRWYVVLEKSPLELHICRCGRLHFYKKEDLEFALNAGKRLILSCSRCGQSYGIWANNLPGFYNFVDEEDFGYTMVSSEIKNETIDLISFMNTKSRKSIPIHKIIISEGKGVFMKTGRSANYFDNDRFRDYDSNFEIMKNYETLDELKHDMDKYDEDRRNISYVDRLTEDEYSAIKDYSNLFPKEIFDNIAKHLISESEE